MSTHTCIIVDDEPLAQDVLTSFVEKTPGLQLVATCSNALEAMQALQEQKVDLMFLDIQMPEITGLEFLRSLSHPPAVVFTTAYSEHAIEGFELDAVDYLLKPIAFDRYLKAVNKAMHQIDLEQRGDAAGSEMEHIFVKADKKIVKIRLKDILYIEGLKDYVMIYTSEERIITLQTMKNLEEFLPSSAFIRVHRSFIVAIDKIKAVSGNSVEIADKFIPIGKHYKDPFMALIEKDNLIK